jgi:hypothetical protein
MKYYMKPDLYLVIDTELDQETVSKLKKSLSDSLYSLLESKISNKMITTMTYEKLDKKRFPISVSFGNLKTLMLERRHK